jgi:hypothetical protein
MNITDILTWLQLHWSDILAVYAGLVAAASVIVRWTPTLRDDNALLAVVKFLGKYVALNRTVDDNALRATLPVDGPTPTDPPYGGTE